MKIKQWKNWSELPAKISGFMKNRDSLHRSGQRMVIVNIMRKTLKL